MHALLFLALFQAPPSVTEPVRSGCSSDDEQIASASPGDSIQVVTALAGDQETCYKIVLTKQGQSPITGYLFGERLPAVAVFVHRREKASQESAEADARRARMVVPKPAAGLAEAAKPSDPLISTQFEEFSGRDPSGKVVSLASLRGRVTLVTFWSPKTKSSQGSLAAVAPLYNQLHKSGLAAVGVSMDPNPQHIGDALDDFSPGFPQVADASGLAARYHVDPRLGKTFVLDESHRIVAVGPINPDFVKTVHQLMEPPEATPNPGN
jgi:peroxiredoxin